MATTWSKESSTKASSTGSTASTSFQLDSGESFLVKNSSSSNIFTIAESSGDVTITGGITVAGASAFDIGDSDKLLLGDGDDFQLYHDGSNSYIANSTGALKLATESSGIAISIGHTTSETTVNDNLTVTGTATFTSGVKLANNIIYASDGGSTITLDTSDNVTIAGDLTISGGNITSALALDSTLSVAGLLTATSGVKLGNNIIYASDGGSTITLDTSDNVTILGDLTISGGNITNAITFDSAVTLSSTINGATLGVDSDSVLVQSTSASSGTSNTIFGKNAGDSIASGGNYNTLFGENAGTALTTGDKNVIIGYNAGDAADDVDGMVLIGYLAGSAINNAEADSIIAIGNSALEANTDGRYNTAIGKEALTSNVQGDSNTAIGWNTLLIYNAESAGEGHNTALGTNSGVYIEYGQYNTAIGSHAMYSNASDRLDGDHNTAVGYRAGYDLEGAAVGNNIFGSRAGENITTGTYNTIFGYEAGDAMTTTSGCVLVGQGAGGVINSTDANYTTAVGYEALLDLTEGQYNTAIGKDAGHNVTTSDYSTFVGFQAGRGNPSTPLTGSSNTAIGYRAGYALEGGGANNILIGAGAGENITTGDDNTIIGKAAGDAMTTSDNCVLIGYAAGGAINSTDANGTVAIGYNALLVNTDGRYNIAIGQSALITNQQGDANIAIGYKALNLFNAESAGEGHNTAIGFNSGEYVEYGVQNTFLGSYAGEGITGDKLDGDANVAIGYSAGQKLQGDANSNTLVGAFTGTALTTGVRNTILGKSAGGAITTANYQTIIGYDCGSSMTTGAGNVVVGYQSLAAVTTNGSDAAGLPTSNTAIGWRALQDMNQTDQTSAYGYNTAIGYDSAKNLTTGEYNVFLGTSSGGSGVITGNYNIAIGYEAGKDLTSGQHNVAVGSYTGDEITTGQYNISVGNYALGANIDGDANTAIGYAALNQFEADSDGHGNNTAVGKEAGYYVSTGTENTFIGANSGKGITSAKIEGNGNTCLGHNSGVELEGAAHSNTLIGTNAGNTTEYGVENTCIGYNVETSGDNSTNQIVIGNNVIGTADNAVHIGNDSSHIRCDFNADQTWDASSDMRQKKDIKDIEAGLGFINALKPVKYKHKSPSEFPQEWTAYNENDITPMGGSDKYYYGFIAQDVKKAIDKYNMSDYSAWAVEPDGRQRVSKESMVVTLVKAVQELSKKVEELENKEK